MNHVDCQFIKFLLKSRETVSRDSKTTETIQYTVIYDRSKLDLIGESSKINIGSLSIVSTTQADSTIANMTWTVKLNKLPNGSKSGEFSFSSCINTTNTDDRFTKLMGDIKQHILIELEFLKKSQLLKQQKQSESTKQHHPLMSQDDYFGDKTDSLIDVIAEHTKIIGIYSENNRLNKTPLYPITYAFKIDASSIDEYPLIKNVVLEIVITRDDDDDDFCQKAKLISINDVKLNGVNISEVLGKLEYVDVGNRKELQFRKLIDRCMYYINGYLELNCKILTV